MGSSINYNGNDDKGSFLEALLFLISHRGVSVERELVELLSTSRFTALLEGERPTFLEAVSIARILGVPVSIFQRASKSSASELEIAFAEILYESASMSKKEREALASKMLKLIHPDSSDVIKILQFQKRK